jgi:hypothetical protein
MKVVQLSVLWAEVIVNQKIHIATALPRGSWATVESTWQVYNVCHQHACMISDWQDF